MKKCTPKAREDDERRREEMLTQIWSNKFDVLNLPGSGLEAEEVNVVDVDRFGSCQERLADPKEGRCENRGDEDGEVGGS